MKKIKPYISFVVTARNDDYGHRFLFRVQNFLDNLIYLCEKYKLHSEIIFVEWNPKKGKNRLWKDLKFKKNRDYTKLRFIEVPNNIHKKFKDSDKFPLFEYIGKNVGIRRAKGKFVLITNPDILFSEELIFFLSNKKLKEDVFYRVARYDLIKDIPEDIPPKKVIEFCKENWSGKLGVYFRSNNLKTLKFKDLKSILRKQIINIGRALFMLFSKKHKYLWYHGGAPGDFILMSKDSWFKFNAFPEIPVPSCGIDGYGCILAVASGIKMKNLKNPIRIYHQYHERPFSKKIQFDYEEYIKKARIMLKNKKIICLNKENWGLKNITLPEKEFN